MEIQEKLFFPPTPVWPEGMIQGEGGGGLHILKLLQQQFYTPPLWGGKTGSICHFPFPLVLQCFGVPRIPRCWEKQHEKCHCHTPFCVPQMLVKIRTWEQCPICWQAKHRENDKSTPFCPYTLPPFFMRSPTPKRVFQGLGWGGYKNSKHTKSHNASLWCDVFLLATHDVNHAISRFWKLP